MKSINKYNEKECLEFALILRDNAEKRWKSGALSEAVDKRGAVSNWIISIEENTKACLFILDSRGTNLRSVAGIEELLKHHKARSAFICLVFVMKILGEVFINYIKIAQDDPKKLLSFVKALKNRDEKTLKFLIEYISNIIKKVKSEAEWFSKLEDLRLSCTYFDASFNEKQFEREFEETKNKLQQTKIALNEFFNSFESDEWVDLNKTFIRMFNSKNKNIYNHISKFLIDQKTKKHNPLKALINELEYLGIEESFDMNNIDLKKIKTPSISPQFQKELDKL